MVGEKWSHGSVDFLQLEEVYGFGGGSE